MSFRKLIFFVTSLACLVWASPLRADSLTFNGFNINGQGLLSFTPGLGNDLTIGAGNGGNGALITDFLNTSGVCSGDCSIVGGYITATSGPETSGFSGGGIFSYSFGAGGGLQIRGEVPSLGINAPVLLLSASFLPGTTFSGAGTVGSFLGQIDLSSIQLDPLLGSYQYTGGSNDELSISINPSCVTGGKCTGSIIQSTTTLQTQATPEPSTLLLLCSGLAGLAGLAGTIRRKILS